MTPKFESEYFPVLHSVHKEKEYPLLLALESIKVEERAKLLEVTFKAACKERDDKAAKRYFGWMMEAVNDTFMAPFSTPKSLTRWTFTYDRNVTAEREVANKTRAACAMELYRGLPTTQRGSHPVQYEMDDIRSEPIDVATLLETRQAMLREVAIRWHATRDEEEADQIFDFLCDQASARFKEERDVVCKAIREATDDTFPLPRLTRHLIRCAITGRSCKHDEVTLILAVARARHADLIVNEMPVLRQLEGCSGHAYVLAAELAGQVKALDNGLAELLNVIGCRNVTREEMVYGNVAFSIAALNAITLTITQDYDNRKPAEEWGNSQFEKARARVMGWKETHSALVRLSLVIQDKFPTREVFARREEL